MYFHVYLSPKNQPETPPELTKALLNNPQDFLLTMKMKKQTLSVIALMLIVGTGNVYGQMKEWNWANTVLPSNALPA